MLRKSPHTLSRSDAVIDATPADGNLVRIQKPKFLSLVGKPANQVAFKVLRDDKGEAPMNNPLVRRQRRSEAGPVLRLTFPEGTDEATVGDALKTYGLTGYTISQDGAVFTATRADLKSISPDKTMDIKLSEDGLVATVARQDSGVEATEPKQQLALVSLEFDATKFNSSTVKLWLEEKAVDGALQEHENPDASYVVRRSEITDTDETRQLEIEDGVTATIVRSDVANVPLGYAAVVNEAAYGGWGWGQLDFAATMADVEFGEHMREALNTLDSVMRNIVFYSSLPVDVRKELANRALAQFGEHIGTIMDSLPRQLLVSVVRSANPQQENFMTTKTGGAGAPTIPATPASAEPTVAATPEVALTRADIAAMIAEGVAAALKPAPAAGETVARADATDDAKDEEKPLTRADFQNMVTEAVKPLAESVEQLKGITVLRSADEQNPKLKGEQDKDVFRGAIPGLGRKASK